MALTEEQKDQVIVMDEAEAFVASRAGRAVLEMAKRDMDDAAHKFSQASVTDTVAMTAIQIEMKVAVRFEQYLYELIQRGREVIASQQ